MNRRARHVVALMLALSLGLHWTVLQSVAWMGMLVNYSTDSSFEEAVIKTFDGRHPCQLCVAVAEGRQSEDQQQPLKSHEKADWLFTDCTLVLDRPVFEIIHSPACLLPDSFVTAPPGPPPRAV